MEKFFKDRKANRQKLLDYGFTDAGGALSYRADIADTQLRLTLTVAEGGAPRADVIDASSGEPYVLHRVSGASGGFVGTVRASVEALLADVAAKCFDRDVFKSEEARHLIEYVREKYGEEPEYLWERFPNNAIWRRRDNRKWYGALLTVGREKLGLAGGGQVEIIDLRSEPEDIAALVNGAKYLPGWHMNKKHWFTMCLDGSVPVDELCGRLEESRRIAGGK